MKSFLLCAAATLALSTPVISVTVWGQCGGIGYSGSTICDAGSQCSYLNDYYFQCLPGGTTTAVSTPISSVAAVSLVSTVPSVAVWGQCGGIGYTGSTTCDAGAYCSYLNDYYSQCLPGTATTIPSSVPSSSISTTSTKTVVTSSSSSVAFSTSSTSTSIKASSVPSSSTPATGTSTAVSPSSSVCSGSRTKFQYFGVNESGAEFGSNIPGVLGTDYTWPSPSSIDYFVGKGFNTFRIPFLMERISPSGLTSGSFDSTYLSSLQSIVSYITGKGGYAVLDPHNYMRFNGAEISDTNAFQTWWNNLAGQFKSNDHVIFDIMNEPNGISAQTTFDLMQAAVNGIRASGATTQLILVEGTAWTGAWSWTTSSGNSAVFGAITDPNNNIAIEMHQYLDSDSSGMSPTCVSSTIGAERLQAATQWLKDNNLKGFLGEIGAGSNSDCIAAVQGALCAMQESGVWLGALWWAAGPWWGDYFTSIEPPNGAAVSAILPQALEPFL